MSLGENLYNLGALIKTNLEKKGVTGLTGNEGLTTLANKILDIKCQSITAYVTGDYISLGGNKTWLTSIGDVVIDWGDGTSDTVNNPNVTLSHTYSDGLSEHLIIFDGTVTSIEYRCFYGCSGLTSVVIPDSVTSLGTACFYNCSGLTSVTIPDSVTNLGEDCFYGCSGLTSIVIPDSVTSIGGQCFHGCSGLTSVTIPDSVTSIGDQCFHGCSGLTSVTIPDSVTSIGVHCFFGCTGLTTYDLYWESNPVAYDSSKIRINTNTVFNIPYGKTQLYVDANYPVARLVERG